jgi:hemolysin activation/secretion protein
VLTPPTGEVGGAIHVVHVRRKPDDAFATIGNRGSHFAGPLAGSIGLDINALGGLGGHVSALYFTTFDREQNYFELSADGRVGGGGLRLRGWGSYALTRPGSVLAPLDIRSRSKVAGLGASYPLLLTRAASLSATASFEVSDDRTDALGLLQTLDRQRILRVSLSAQERDPWGGFSAGSVTAHKGLDMFNASEGGGAVPQSRIGGRSDFFKLTATASHYRPIAATSWGVIGLQLSAAGQYAGHSLLALEQFRAGGESFGRGFNPSQLTGDHGVAVSGELQVTRLASAGPFQGGQLYGFWDRAVARDRRAGARWSDIASVGAGVRFDLGAYLSGQFEVAVPYDGGRQVGARLDRGAQAFFRLTARY